METLKFRNLKASEIEIRLKKKYATSSMFLLFKDARCDMKMLDETVGTMGWQRSHYECKGNLFCQVGIYNGKEWIYKSDCGIESRTDEDGNEKKGEASDSFKRACTNWGIGRELYTSPRIFISNDMLEFNDKNQLISVLEVSEIETIDGIIKGLKITDIKHNKVVFSYGTLKTQTKPPVKKEAPKEVLTLAKAKNLTMINTDGQQIPLDTLTDEQLEFVVSREGYAEIYRNACKMILEFRNAERKD